MPRKGKEQEMSNQQKKAFAWLKIHQESFGKRSGGSIIHEESRKQEKSRSATARKRWFVRGSDKKN